MFCEKSQEQWNFFLTQSVLSLFYLFFPIFLLSLGINLVLFVQEQKESGIL